MLVRSLGLFMALEGWWVFAGVVGLSFGALFGTLSIALTAIV